MRPDPVRFGVQEARTAADVDSLLGPSSGTVMMITNSVCGCAAGRARPAIGMALCHAVEPGKAASVFAGIPPIGRITFLRKIPNCKPLELSDLDIIGPSKINRPAAIYFSSLQVGAAKRRSGGSLIRPILT